MIVQENTVIHHVTSISINNEDNSLSAEFSDGFILKKFAKFSADMTEQEREQILQDGIIKGMLMKEAVQIREDKK
jgi:hypothetical protein